MPRNPESSAFLEGVRDGLPFVIVIVPFGAIFGALAAEAGWGVASVLGMSVLVIAGASQLTALQLLEEGAPLLVVVMTALAVNLRLAMYSASLAPHLRGISGGARAAAAYVLVDHTYGLAMHRFGRDPLLGPSAKLAYLLGTMAPVALPWYVASWAGAVAGSAIPPGLALDFAIPVTFLALVAPALRSAPHVAAAAVSVVLALGFAGLPYSLWLMLAAPVAMAAGALVEALLEARRG